MELAITVGISIFVICIWSTSISSLIPRFAGALKIDPTVISGPLMSTLIDTTGLVIYISQAILIVPQL